MIVVLSSTKTMESTVESKVTCGCCNGSIPYDISKVNIEERLYTMLLPFLSEYTKLMLEGLPLQIRRLTSIFCSVDLA